MNRPTLAALTVLLSCVLGACRSSTPPPAPPQPLEVALVGTDSLNGGGNAVVVRLYALAGDAAFQQAPVQSFWQDEAAALGSDLLGGAREVTLFPGAREQVQLQPDPRAQFVGIAADLREPARDGWRAVYPVSELRGRRVTVTVGVNAMAVDLGAQ